MNEKKRSRLKHESQEIRKAYGLPQLDVRKLMGNDVFRQAVMNAARQAEKHKMKGENNNESNCTESRSV